MIVIPTNRILVASNINMSNSISIIGCGWLGLPLGSYLVEKGYDVKGSTTRSQKFPLLKEKGIVSFLIKVGKNLEGENIDIFFQSKVLIINIPPGRHRSDVENIHPKEVKNIVEKAATGDVEKIIFVSSIGVYSNSNNVVTEEDSPNPTTSSGKALTQIEQFLKKDTRFQTTILRMAGLVGGERKAGRFLAGKKNIPNGLAPVNLVHRDDCTEVIYQIIKQACWNEVCHVCSDEHPKRKEFYTQQAKKQ